MSTKTFNEWPSAASAGNDILRLNDAGHDNVDVDGLLLCTMSGDMALSDNPAAALSLNEWLLLLLLMSAANGDVDRQSIIKNRAPCCDFLSFN
uniref:Uncharacterized protein n=1 Tax=Romanomermis culicivorax TaxID=13658 RepID=A0A915KBY8_ROMCU